VCDKGPEEGLAKSSLIGKLVHRIAWIGGINVGELHVPIDVWELHVGDQVHLLSIPEALRAEARRLEGKLVNVGGDRWLTSNPPQLQVETLEEVIAFLPLPILPQIEHDPRAPQELLVLELKEVDLFGSLFEGPDGFTLTTDEGKVLKVLVLSGNSDALLKDARQAPTLNAVIHTRGQITGELTQQVEDLVRILRAGALPATLKRDPVSENTIGATLGEDTIRSGVRAVFWAFVAVLG
jgi:hypothetical protein